MNRREFLQGLMGVALGSQIPAPLAKAAEQFLAEEPSAIHELMRLSAQFYPWDYKVILTPFNFYDRFVDELHDLNPACLFTSGESSGFENTMFKARAVVPWPIEDILFVKDYPVKQPGGWYIEAASSTADRLSSIPQCKGSA